ncbi:MAG: putative transporter [Rhodoglobus sp.]|nr:putative transporter [Rhodoglobus sp.]
MATSTRGVALNSTLIVVAQSTQAIAVGAIALFLPLIRADLGITFAQAGLLAAVSTGTYALMQVPSGVLADRVSPKRVFAVGVVGANVFAILFAVSDSFAIMLVTQAIAGIFRALIFVPGIILISRHFSAARRATAMGLFVAGGFSSNIVVNLLGPLFVDAIGWQGIIVVSSTIGLVVTLAFILLADDGPPREHTDAGSVRWVWRTRAWWLLGLIQFCRLSVVMGFGLWLPAFLVVDRGLPIATAGLIVAASAAITAPSNIGGGMLSDRLHRPLLVIGVSLGAMVVLFALIGEIIDLVPLLVVIGLISVFIQLYFGPLFAVPGQLFGPGVAGLSSGFGNLCANIGGFTSALTLGVLKDVTGSFSLGFLCLGVLALLGVVAVIALSRSSPVRAGG